MKNGKAKKRFVKTWCGSHVEVVCDDKCAAVINGLQAAMENKDSIGVQLGEVLLKHMGERSYKHAPNDENVIDCLHRIIYERDMALQIIACDRLREGPRIY